MTIREQAQIKSAKIARVGALDVVLKKYRLKIHSTREIEGGVEVLVQAWNLDGSPVGFGDGTVEIERIFSMNPSVMFQRETGLMVEDPRAAMLVDIEHTVSLIALNGENIISGKVGSTVSTFNPAVDGYLDYNGAAASFATYRGQTVCSSVSTGDTNATGPFLSSGAGTPNYSRMRKAVFITDTSALSGLTLNGVFVSFYTTVIENTGGFDLPLNLSTVTPTTDLALITADYDPAKYGSTPLAPDILSSQLNLNAYTDFIMTGAGVAAINKTGNTRLALRFTADITNTTPTWPGASLATGPDINYTDSGSNKPKITVLHSLLYQPRVLLNQAPRRASFY